MGVSIVIRLLSCCLHGFLLLVHIGIPADPKDRGMLENMTYNKAKLLNGQISLFMTVSIIDLFLKIKVNDSDSQLLFPLLNPLLHFFCLQVVGCLIPDPGKGILSNLL